MVTNQYHIFEDVIEKDICDKIKDKTNEEWESASTMDETWDEEEGWIVEEKPDLKSRISSIAWSEDVWLYDVIWPYMLEANEESGWKYNIQNAEAMQITKYEKGGFYGFHTDGRGDYLSIYNNPDTPEIDGYVRKLSMSISLNKDFEGGAFQFASYSNEKCEIETVEVSMGSIIVFPSFLEHRVEPVTKGTRYSVVTWFTGPPFV